MTIFRTKVIFFSPRNVRDTVFGGWSKQKTAFDEVCPINPWTLHDLRRTFAHQWQRMGIKIEHTEATLNHISGTRGGIVGVYQTYNYETELKDFYAQWEKRPVYHFLCHERVIVKSKMNGSEQSAEYQGALRSNQEDDLYWNAWYQCRRCGAVTREHDHDDFLVVHPEVTKRHLEKTEMG